jgi:multidrug efflux pump subunit AcrA (membrane-fusion protein)
VDIARTTAAPARRRRVVITGALGSALLVLAGWTLWRSSASAAPVAERSSAWIEKVGRGDIVREVAVQGTLVPEHVQWLSATSAARVAHRDVKPGQVVDPDTVVVTLENPELELAVLEADRAAANAQSMLIQLDVRAASEAKASRATVVGLQADLRDAKLHAQIADRLTGQMLMSANDKQDAVNKEIGLKERIATEDDRRQLLESGRSRQIDAQRADVEHLQAIAAFRHQQVADLQVRAGIHGVVQDMPLENGQWVAIGTLLAKVAEPDKLKADVHVAEGNARDVHKGLEVRFEGGGASAPFRGRIERVDPSVVAGSVKLEVLFDAPLPKGARADQTVTGYVEIEKMDHVLHVARPSGVQEGATAGIFRLEPDGVHADRVPVRFGRSSAREMEILGGLSEGDQIVVSDTTTWETAGRIHLK